MKASQNIVSLSARLRRLTTPTILLLALSGAWIQASGTTVRQDPDVEVYLYNSSDTPVDQSNVDLYQEGHIFDIATGSQIGNVPDTTEGSIVDDEGNTIGFIAPSTRASAELLGIPPGESVPTH